MGFKKILLSFLFVAGFLFLSINSFASHIFGGELLYKNISGNTYKITLTLYGDCKAVIFGSLDTSRPAVNVYNGNSLYSALVLSADTIEYDVSPVCPAQINNTTCSSPAGTLPGVKKFVYSEIVTLPIASSNWRFIFTSNLSVSSAGRSGQITNIMNPSGSGMQLEATLNNLSGANNSPNYSTIPTPFYCLGVNQQYNQGAIDVDGDSLSFSLVPGIEANITDPLASAEASYVFPFSGGAPMSTVAGTFVFDSLNGQMVFTPNASQDALVVNQVSEYRNGVLVGTSKREMTFIVTEDCGGGLPSLHIANITGGALGSNNIIKMCSGTPFLSFNINLSNPGGDTTTLDVGNLPPAAVLTVNNNNTASPGINFSWNTDTLTTGVYTFYVYLKNNHCPIASRQTIAYTINVVPLPSLSAMQLSPTNCVHDAYVQYNLANGYIPRTLTITEDGITVKTYTDSTGLIKDSLGVGNYVITASSNPVCQIASTFSITDSGKLPLDPFSVSYCEGAPAVAIPLPVPGPFTITTWYDANDVVLPAAPVPNTAVPGTYNWFATEHYKVCTSDLATVSVVVHPLPQIDILNKPSSICLGDTIYLEATGGLAYTWQPADRIETSLDGRLYTRLITGGTFTVKAVNEFNCLDSSSITYSNIQPCCTFFYPNAFTPNGDSHNDGFRVGTYGNMYDYKLTIFNRWGQVVFVSADPYAYWDGKLYGTPCEVGTYYYTFKGRCLTGITEEKKGDVILIR